MTASTRRKEELLEPAVQQEVQECELGAQPAPSALGVQGKILLGAFPPELPHAAVGRHPVAVVQAHGGGVDDAAVADRERDGEAERARRQRARDQHVLVLDVDQLDPLLPGRPAHGPGRVQVEERIGEPLGRQRRAARRQAAREGKAHDADAFALLARGSAVVWRHDHNLVPAARQRTGEGIHAPLRATGSEGREILVDEADPHIGFRARARKPVLSPGSARARRRFHRARRA